MLSERGVKHIRPSVLFASLEIKITIGRSILYQPHVQPVSFIKIFP